MSIFKSSLRAGDRRSALAKRAGIGLESEELQTQEAVAEVQQEQLQPSAETAAVPTGASNVTGVDTAPAGLAAGEEPGVEVPGESLDVKNLVEAEAQADEVQEQVEEVQKEAEVAAVALEAISYRMHAALRSGFGLESLSEQLQATVEGDGEGIDARTAQMVITANDALAGSTDVESGLAEVDDSADAADTGEVAGVAGSGGDEQGGQEFGTGNAALESFMISSRYATESLAEEASNKAASFFKSVGDTITRMGASVKRRFAELANVFKKQSEVLEKLSASAEALGAQAGKPLNEDAVAALREDLPMTGDGNKALLTLITREIPAFIDAAAEHGEAAAQLAKSLDPADPEQVLREAKRYFQAVGRKLNKKGAVMSVSFKAPEFTSLDELATLKPSAVAIETAMIAQNGTQSYKVVTAQEVGKLAAAVKDLEEALGGERLATAGTKLGDGFIERIKKERAAAAEQAAEMRVARKAYANLMIIANKVNASFVELIEVTGTSAASHATNLVRASLAQATKPAAA